jgi:hypothetical protein
MTLAAAADGQAWRSPTASWQPNTCKAAAWWNWAPATRLRRMRAGRLLLHRPRRHVDAQPIARFRAWLAEAVAASPDWLA